MDVLVTYDIRTLDLAGERRLSKVAAICERYGVRVQYSVFECRLDGILLERLVAELMEVIEPSQDSVNLYRLGTSFESARRSIGTPGLDWNRSWVL